MNRADAYRSALPAAGLTAPSAHARLLETGAPVEEILDIAASLGVQTVIDPMVDPERWTSADGVKAIASGLGATPGQVALAWLLARQPWVVPIPGTTKPHRLTENIGAADVDLSAADVDRLTALSDSVEIVGGRYPDFLEEQTNR